MATVLEVRQYLGTMSAILWNYGATFPVPTLDEYGGGQLGFSLRAELPGPATPRPSEIKLAEIWASEAPGTFTRVEYAYDFIEYPLARRRAFHGHHPEHFAREFGVLIHEHCEEALGVPACDHYYGLPLNALDVIDRFAAIWGQARQLGCAGLRCMD